MKSTAAAIHTEPVRWSLSWNPDGRSESFTREAILAAAPAASGVYGLFNFDCQLFIGGAANIREALLRHASETDFQPAHLRPTGFTFEPCAAELRSAKAAGLIAKFRPVLQTEAILTEASPQSNSSFVSTAPVDSALFETDSDQQEFPVDEREEHPHARSRCAWKRAIPAALFAAVAILYLGLLTNKNIQEQANGASATTLARTPLAQPPELEAPIASRPQSAPSIAASAPAKSETDATASTPVSSNKWSVQISAVPAKAAADALTERLKASGYNSYVIRAEVKGQSYYRVRVGRFATQADAESARQSLAHKEGYRDAYLTGD